MNVGYALTAFILLLITWNFAIFIALNCRILYLKAKRKCNERNLNKERINNREDSTIYSLDNSKLTN